jgi:hypothetical protein
MKKAVYLPSMIAGGLFMAAAFFQWISFQYPDVYPLRFGATFASGIANQFINWVIVCLTATVGWMLFSFGKTKLAHNEKNK